MNLATALDTSGVSAVAEVPALVAVSAISGIPVSDVLNKIEGR